MQGILRALSLNFSPQLRQNHLPGRFLDSLSRTILTFIPSPALTTRGGSILHEDTVENRYSYKEPRNLSCGREYGAFQLLQPFRGKCPLSRLRR